MNAHDWIRKYHATMDGRSMEIMREGLYAEKAMNLYFQELDLDVEDEIAEIDALLVLVGGNPSHVPAVYVIANSR